MKLPERQVEFANGLTIPVRTVQPQSWQYHVLKHALGIDRSARRTGDDPEGWSDLQPPVIESGWRDAIFEEIRHIDVDGARCALPEVSGRKPTKREAGQYACWACPTGVARRCEEATHGARPVGHHYLEALQSIIDSVADGVLVSRSEYMSAVMTKARNLEALQGLCVMAMGRAANSATKPIARFQSSNGIVVEFVVHDGGHSARWRTCYRKPASGTALLNQMLALPTAMGDPLSESCVVARQWWESHGNI